MNKTVTQTIFAGILSFLLFSCASAGPAAGSAQSGEPGIFQVGPEQEAWLKGQAIGYASLEGGATGGLGADPSRIFLVENRAQLVSALGSASGEDKTIVFVKGTVDLSADGRNRPLAEADFAVAPYTIEAYLSAYDPKVWNNGGGKGFNQDAKDPSGPLEEARKASVAKQAAHIVVQVPSNTSIIGLGDKAVIKRGQLALKNVSNVVIRNIFFEDSYDFFPAWDPTDGSTGNWNSEYDLVALQGSSRVWIDHCSFSDGERPDSQNPVYFGKGFQHHDGLVDITAGSDLVTLSYNHFFSHDKTSLIGSSDSATGDRGKLRVTIHHNLYDGAKQRSPRVRFGEVHVFNNYYKSASYGPGSGYAIGLGVEASVYAEANYFEKGVAAISWYDKATAKAFIQSVGNVPEIRVTKNGQDAVSWKPSDRYSYAAADAETAKNLVLAQAGAGKKL